MWACFPVLLYKNQPTNQPKKHAGAWWYAVQVSGGLLLLSLPNLITWYLPLITVLIISDPNLLVTLCGKSQSHAVQCHIYIYRLYIVNQHIHECVGYNTYHWPLQWPKCAHQSVPMKVLLCLSDSYILQTLGNLLQHFQLFLPLSSQVLLPSNLRLNPQLDTVLLFKKLPHVVHLHC